ADSNGLATVTSRLRPGSSVSFYFDDRIKRAPYSDDLRPAVEHVIDRDVDIVFGVLAADQVEIRVEFLSSSSELAEVTSDLNSSSQVFFGFFPARDNDGVNA